MFFDGKWKRGAKIGIGGQNGETFRNEDDWGVGKFMRCGVWGVRNLKTRSRRTGEDEAEV